MTASKRYKRSPELTLEERNKEIENSITWYCQKPETIYLILVGTLVLANFPHEDNSIPINNLLASGLTDLILDPGDLFQKIPSLKKWRKNFESLEAPETKRPTLSHNHKKEEPESKAPTLSHNNKKIIAGMFQTILHNLEFLQNNEKEVLAVIEKCFVRMHTERDPEPNSVVKEISRDAAQFLDDIKAIQITFLEALIKNRKQILTRYKGLNFANLENNLAKTSHLIFGKLNNIFKKQNESFSKKKDIHMNKTIPILGFMSVIAKPTMYCAYKVTDKVLQLCFDEDFPKSNPIIKEGTAFIFVALVAIGIAKLMNRPMESASKATKDEYKKENAHLLQKKALRLKIYWRPLTPNEAKERGSIEGRIADFDLDLSSEKPITQHPKKLTQANDSRGDFKSVDNTEKDTADKLAKYIKKIDDNLTYIFLQGIDPGLVLKLDRQQMQNFFTLMLINKIFSVATNNVFVQPPESQEEGIRHVKVEGHARFYMGFTGTLFGCERVHLQATPPSMEEKHLSEDVIVHTVLTPIKTPFGTEVILEIKPTLLTAVISADCKVDENRQDSFQTGLERGMRSRGPGIEILNVDPIRGCQVVRLAPTGRRSDYGCFGILYIDDNNQRKCEFHYYTSHRHNQKELEKAIVYLDQIIEKRLQPTIARAKL